MKSINSGLVSGGPLSRDFIDSVLYRFALMKLPLREGGWTLDSASYFLFLLMLLLLLLLLLHTEDISVSEDYETRKVLRSSLRLLAEEANSVLQGEGRGRGGRREGGGGLGLARRQLQGLLEILET